MMNANDGGLSEPTNMGALIQLALVGAIIAICTLLFNYFFQQHNKRKDDVNVKGNAANGAVAVRKKENAKKAAAVASQKAPKKVSKSVAAARLGVLKFKHADHVGTLKAHSSEISDMALSSNGKYLASVSADERSVILWSAKELANDSNRNTIRAKIELDNPMTVNFSPDCKALALGVELANTVKVMKIGKKEGAAQPALVEGSELPQVLQQDLLTCAISPSGNYVMVADSKHSIYILSLRGDIYGKIDASTGGRGKIFHCEISPCGRFVAFCGYSPEVFIYEVEFASQNVFKGIKRVMVLKGHLSSATHFAFSLDAVSMATVSNDSTWQLHSIDVRYKDNEAPKVLKSGQHTLSREDAQAQLKCMLSCNGKLLGIYDETSIELMNTSSGDTIIAYSEFGSGLAITKCLFDNSSKHAIVCIGKHMVVLSVYKYHLEATIEGLEQQLKQPMAQSARSRLQNQLKTEKEKLENFIKEKTVLAETAASEKHKK